MFQVEEKTLHGALTTRKSLAGGTDFFVTPYRIEEVRTLYSVLIVLWYSCYIEVFGQKSVKHIYTVESYITWCSYKYFVMSPGCCYARHSGQGSLWSIVWLDRRSGAVDNTAILKHWVTTMSFLSLPLSLSSSSFHLSLWLGQCHTSCLWSPRFS